MLVGLFGKSLLARLWWWVVGSRCPGRRIAGPAIRLLLSGLVIRLLLPELRWLAERLLPELLRLPKLLRSGLQWLPELLRLAALLWLAELLRLTELRLAGRGEGMRSGVCRVAVRRPPVERGHVQENSDDAETGAKIGLPLIRPAQQEEMCVEEVEQD